MAAPEKVTRFSASLVDAAASAGRTQERSARQQLEHWVRIGRSVSEQTSAARRRVELALSGTLAPEDLSEEESVVFAAEVEAGIAEKMASTNFAALRAERGLSSVALDDNGELVEYLADGTTRPLDRR